MLFFPSVHKSFLTRSKHAILKRTKHVLKWGQMVTGQARIICTCLKRSLGTYFTPYGTYQNHLNVFNTYYERNLNYVRARPYLGFLLTTFEPPYHSLCNAPLLNVI